MEPRARTPGPLAACALLFTIAACSKSPPCLATSADAGEVSPPDA